MGTAMPAPMPHKQGLSPTVRDKVYTAEQFRAVHARLVAADDLKPLGDEITYTMGKERTITYGPPKVNPGAYIP